MNFTKCIFSLAILFGCGGSDQRESVDTESVKADPSDSNVLTNSKFSIEFDKYNKITKLSGFSYTQEVLNLASSVSEKGVFSDFDEQFLNEYKIIYESDPDVFIYEGIREKDSYEYSNVIFSTEVYTEQGERNVAGECQGLEYNSSIAKWSNILKQINKKSKCGIIPIDFCIRVGISQYSKSNIGETTNQYRVFNFVRSPSLKIGIPCKEDIFSSELLKVSLKSSLVLEKKLELKIMGAAHIKQVSLYNTQTCIDGTDYLVSKEDFTIEHKFEAEVSGEYQFFYKIFDYYERSNDCQKIKITYEPTASLDNLNISTDSGNRLTRKTKTLTCLAGVKNQNGNQDHKINYELQKNTGNGWETLWKNMTGKFNFDSLSLSESLEKKVKHNDLVRCSASLQSEDNLKYNTQEINTLDYDGSEKPLAAPNCKYIKNLGVEKSGKYWINPSSLDEDQAFQAYCEMTVNNGGWMLVANQANIGNWINANLNFSPYISFGKYSPDWDHISSYFKSFDNIVYSEFTFITGDLTHWCTVDPIELAVNNSDLNSLGVNIKNSSGFSKLSGQSTNILNRTSNPEDPWFSCEGTHNQNKSKMLWGESGDSNYVDWKNSVNGVGLFIR